MMHAISYTFVRHLSTQSQHYRLVVVGAGCGGLACASKFASKLGKDQIAIIDKNDVSPRKTAHFLLFSSTLMFVLFYW